jgi:hypothetical protein
MFSVVPECSCSGLWAASVRRPPAGPAPDSSRGARAGFPGSVFVISVVHQAADRDWRDAAGHRSRLRKRKPDVDER